VSAAEYDVLSAWIAGTFKGQESKEGVGKDIVKIVILNLTQSDENDTRLDENGRPIPWKEAASLIKQSPALQRTTIDAFREVNAQQASLRRSFHYPIDYELVDSTQLDSIFNKNGGSWSAYYKRFPGSQGVLALSRVGFSADGTQALFYLSNRCGGLCGGGRYVVMEKLNDRWMIGKEVEKWVS
jgi:hypothetical protein